MDDGMATSGGVIGKIQEVEFLSIFLPFRFSTLLRGIYPREYNVN